MVMKSVEKKTWFTRALLTLLAVQFALLVFVNLFRIENLLDFDAANTLRHIVELARSKSLLINGWKYATTMEIDNTALFALPFYFITKNIYIAAGLSNILIIVIFALAVLYLFNALKKNIIYPALAMNLILIPYSIGQLSYVNMMFINVAPYTLKVIIPVIFVALLLRIEERSNVEGGFRLKPYDYVAAAFLLLFTVLTTISSGSYTLLCALIPVAVGYFVYKLFKWEKCELFSVILIVLMFAIALPCVIKNNSLMGGALGNTTRICSIYQLEGNIFAQIKGIFELFGGMAYEVDIEVVSVLGIEILFKNIYTIVLIAFTIAALVKSLRGKSDLFHTLSLSVCFINFFVLIFTFTTYGVGTSEFRYHIMGSIQMMIITVLDFLDYTKKEEKTAKASALKWAVFFAVAVIGIISHKNLLTTPDANVELKELAGYIRNLPENVIYYYEFTADADILRALDVDKDYVTVSSEGRTYIRDFFLKYQDQFLDTDNGILVLDTEKYTGAGHFYLGNCDVNYMDTVGRYEIYRLTR